MDNLSRNTKNVFLLFAFLLIGLASNAQRNLTLDDCIAIALENNIDIKRAINSALVADLNAKQSRYNFLPSLNGSGNWSSNNGLVFDQTIGFSTATTNQFSSGLFADVTIFDGFSNRINSKIARLDRNISDYDVIAAKDNIKASVVSLYLQVITDIENQRISQERISLLTKQKERAEKRAKLGVDNYQQVYNLSSQIASENLAKVNLENQYKSDLLILIQTLQLDVNLEYTIEKIELPKDLENEQVQYDAIMEQARRYSPVLKSTEIALESAKSKIKLTRGNMLPTLAARASYGSRYSSRNFEDDGSKRVFFDQIKENESRGLSLNLRIPIFNKFQTKTDVQIARIDIASSELGIKQAETDLANNIQRAYLDYVSAQSTFRAAEENLLALRQAFIFMETSFNAGSADLYNYLEALNNKNRAEIDLVNSKYSIVLRRRVLDIYQGLN